MSDLPRQRVQVWLPLFELTPLNAAYARDLQRAQKEWRGEPVIWLLPDIREVKRWYWDFRWFRFWECAVPSETINRILVLHVTEEGFCYPPIGIGLPQSWEGKIPEGLFRKWLNAGRVSLVPGLKEIKTTRPVFEGDRLSYEERLLKVEPGPVVPIVSFDENTGEFTCAWPPPGSHLPSSVSPETESQEICGPVVWEEKPLSPELPTALDRSGSRSVNVWLQWPEPFNEMFPFGGSMDLMFHKALIKRCIEDLNEGKPGVLDEIASWASRFTSQGWTTLELAYIAPTLEARGSKGLLTDIEGKYDIVTESLRELFSHADYCSKFRHQVDIPRVFGWLGYFWWELNQVVNESKEHVPICERCGWVLQGTRKKRYCGPNDNLECFRSRRAEDKRKERQRQKLEAFLKNSPA